MGLASTSGSDGKHSSSSLRALVRYCLFTLFARAFAQVYYVVLKHRVHTSVLNTNTNQPKKTKRTQRKKGKPPLSGGDPYDITLIRLNQVSLDRRRREKFIWEMITEHSCKPFANLESVLHNT